jgi:peptide/nickel transport system permease protein
MAEPAPLTRSVARGGATVMAEPAGLATGARRIRQRQLRRLWRNPLSVAGAAIVLLLITCAAVPALLAPFPEDAGPNVHFEQALQPPNRQHWFGTDDVGRDVLSRAVFGARVSLALVAVVLGVALGVGIPLGLHAGYWHGSRTSAFIMRVTDIFLSVPPLALALAAAAAFKPDLTGAMVAISFTWWPWFARLVYGEVLVKREEPYVEAARALGHRDSVITVKQILPNIISPIVVKATLDVSFVILLGSSLAFLGLGAQEPTPDWGAMVARGRTFLPEHWWLSTMPGLAIFVAVMGFNLLGDALRDALDVWE